MSKDKLTDYDATANNAPLGYYLFRKLVPARSQNTTLYATSTGVTSLVDSSDQPIEGFAGYKDFRRSVKFAGWRAAEISTMRNPC